MSIPLSKARDDNRADLSWRYLPRGTVVHALTKVSNATAECGAGILPASEWRGTGSQREYETAERLPMCRRCLAVLGVVGRRG